VKNKIDVLLDKIGDNLSDNVLTLGELVDIAEKENIPLSQLVVAEAMIKEGSTCEEILDRAFSIFEHNFKALEVGLTSGRSFLLGRLDLIWRSTTTCPL